MYIPCATSLLVSFVALQDIAWLLPVYMHGCLLIYIKKLKLFFNFPFFEFKIYLSIYIKNAQKKNILCS